MKPIAECKARIMERLRGLAAQGRRPELTRSDAKVACMQKLSLIAEEKRDSVLSNALGQLVEEGRVRQVLVNKLGRDYFWELRE